MPLNQIIHPNLTSRIPFKKDEQDMLDTAGKSKNELIIDDCLCIPTDSYLLLQIDMYSYRQTLECWPTSQILYSSIMYRHWISSRLITKVYDQ